MALRSKKTFAVKALWPVLADFLELPAGLRWYPTVWEIDMSSRRPRIFEPEELAKLGSAYDEAWASLAAGFEHAGETVQAAAKAKLAGIMLELVEQQLMPESLKQRALTMFQFDAAQAADAEATSAA